MKTWIVLSLISLAFSFSLTANALAAVPGLTQLPNLTAYLECRADTCAMADLQQKAKFDAKSRGTGTYQYLLGNVATGELSLVIVEYEAPNRGYGEPGFVLLRGGGPVPSDYTNQFDVYTVAARKGPIVVPVPPTISPKFPTNEAEVAAVSGYLRALPIFSNVFVALDHPIVTVTFSNGDTAKFVYVSAFTEGGIAFRYVPGTARDKNGNPIPDADLRGVVMLLEGGQFNGAGSAFGILISNVPVYVDWQQGGTVSVGPLCDSDGNCVITVSQ